VEVKKAGVIEYYCIDIGDEIGFFLTPYLAQ
jgi:hypothetical protein